MLHTMSDTVYSVKLDLDLTLTAIDYCLQFI